MFPGDLTPTVILEVLTEVPVAIKAGFKPGSKAFYQRIVDLCGTGVSMESAKCVCGCEVEYLFERINNHGKQEAKAKIANGQEKDKVAVGSERPSNPIPSN